MNKYPAATALFAIAMAFVEAAVVVYLRALYYPEGFNFPLKEIRTDILIIEMIREAATIVMLACVAWIAGRRFLERFAYFALAFGVWDLFYYIFLKMTLGWPESLFDWDVLFLIPPMVGPVLAPILVSFCLVITSLIVIRRENSDSPVQVQPAQWIFSIIGGCIVIFSFLTNIDLAMEQPDRAEYPWFLFAAGFATASVSFLTVLRNQRTVQTE